jgi:hypothetical protein
MPPTQPRARGPTIEGVDDGHAVEYDDYDDVVGGVMMMMLMMMR